MSNQEMDEIDVGELFQTILAGWRIVFLSILTAVVAAVSYTSFVHEELHQAHTEVRVLPQLFCPPRAAREQNRMTILFDGTTIRDGNADCDIPLPAALDQAIERVSTTPIQQNLLAQVASVLGPNAPELAAAPSFTMQAGENKITLDVAGPGSEVVVAFANIAAEALAEHVNALANDNLEIIALDLRQRIESLTRSEILDGEVAVAMAIERAAIEGRLQIVQSYVSNNRAPAQVSSYSVTASAVVDQGWSMIVFLSGFVGLMVGCVLAIANSVRTGVLHGSRSLANAFGTPEVVRLGKQSRNKPTTKAIWQELRVAIGEPDKAVIAIGGEIADSMLKQACLGLYREFEQDGKDVALLDLSRGLLNRQVTKKAARAQVTSDPGESTTTFKSTTTEAVITELATQHQLVIVALPSAQSDLPLMHRAFQASTARILMVKTGMVTREVVGKIRLAEKDADGKRVVVIA